MKAVKKPIPIEVEEFRPDHRPWPTNVLRAEGRFVVWNATQGTYIPINPGDYVVVENGSDSYPIPRCVFDAVYDIIES